MSDDCPHDGKSGFSSVSVSSHGRGDTSHGYNAPQVPPVELCSPVELHELGAVTPAQEMMDSATIEDRMSGGGPDKELSSPMSEMSRSRAWKTMVSS